MKSWLLDLLACTRCESQAPLIRHAESSTDDDIPSGNLVCQECGAIFGIEGGIPRFVDVRDDYCGNFGFQWRYWKTIQIDRLSGHGLSQSRFFRDTGWDPVWLAGKTILDCGCGAGRFADVAAGFGARVVACDISAAVEACRDNTVARDGRVQPIQASLFDLPLRAGSFDGVFCMGVIQHTPDPSALMRSLPHFLKPGGRLVYNFYEADFWPWLQIPKYVLRLITPRLPVKATLALSRFLVALFHPLTSRLATAPKIRIVNHVIPICTVHEASLSREQQRIWTLLDTFDWYSPLYEKRQNHLRVARLLRDSGLVDVTSRPGIATARRPEPA